MENKITTPVVKGLILSLVMIVYGLALHFSGQMMNKGLSYINYAILLAGIIWGCISYANQMDNNVTFGNIFSHGFKMTAVTTVIMIVYSAIAVKLLFPEMVEQIVAQASKDLEKRDMSDEQREQAITMTRKFFFPFMIAGILFGFMIMGVIASLIGAAVSKKNPNTPFAEQVNQ